MYFGVLVSFNSHTFTRSIGSEEHVTIALLCSMCPPPQPAPSDPSNGNPGGLVPFTPQGKLQANRQGVRAGILLPGSFAEFENDAKRLCQCCVYTVYEPNHASEWVLKTSSIDSNILHRKCMRIRARAGSNDDDPSRATVHRTGSMFRMLHHALSSLWRARTWLEWVRCGTVDGSIYGIASNGNRFVNRSAIAVSVTPGCMGPFTHRSKSSAGIYNSH
jgi:hypothetical protein